MRKGMKENGMKKMGMQENEINKLEIKEIDMQEIRMRKKKVFVMILVASLFWNQISTSVVQAADYNNIVGDENAIGQGDILSPGDTISCQALSDEEIPTIALSYYDVETAEQEAVWFYSGSIENGTPHTIMGYEDAVGLLEDGSTPALTTETFGGWKVNEVYASAGVVTSINLIAVPKYTITYELNGGTNASTNPTEYIYGVGVAGFEEPSKEGNTFAGWYSDAEFSNRVESISVTQTENIILYAKWEENVIEEEAIAIETSGYVSLKAGVAYTLGEGTWQVVGDDTIYMGGSTFYVSENVEYEFSKQ